MAKTLKNNRTRAAVAAPAAPAEPRQTVAERVTAAILAALDRGVPPWRKPWEAGTPALASAIPLRSCGRPYRGVNILLLWEAAAVNGFASPYWFTFKQALDLGAAVRKGEKASHVVYWGELKGRADDQDGEGEGETDQGRTRLFSRLYAVFNADQIDGLPDRFHTPPAAAPVLVETGRRPDLDAAFARVGATVKVGGDQACYNSLLDVIRLPALAQFRDGSQFYATFAHELAHWTGHPSRLDRQLGNRFGSDAYAAEELIAELAAAFIGAHAGLPVDHVESHAGYIGHWRKVLKDDPRAILTAASKAQAAADYLLDRMGLAPADPGDEPPPADPTPRPKAPKAPPAAAPKAPPAPKAAPKGSAAKPARTRSFKPADLATALDVAAACAWLHTDSARACVVPPQSGITGFAFRLAVTPARPYPAGVWDKLSLQSARYLAARLEAGQAPEPALSSDQVRPMDNGQTWPALADPALLDGVAKVARACSRDETRYYLQGVFCHALAPAGGLAIVGTDGHRLYRQAFEGLDAPASHDPFGPGQNGVILHADAIAVLQRARKAWGDPTWASIAPDGRHVLWNWSNGATLEGACVDGSFPDYTRVVPTLTGGEASLVSDCAAADLAALKAAMSQARKLGANRVINLRASQTGAVLGFHPQGGDGWEYPPIAGCSLRIARDMKAAPGHPTCDAIGFNAAYVADILDAMGPGAFVAAVSDPGSPVRFDRGDFTAVLMPLRV